GGAYSKIERQVGDLAIAAAGASLTVLGDVIADARIGLPNVADTVVRARGAEAALIGQRLDDAGLRAAAQLAVEGLSAWSDARASREYKLEATKVTTYRALRKAADRATTGS